MTHMTFREPTPTQWLVLAFGLGLGGLWGCDDPEAASAWMNSLPRGPAFDQAASGLIRSLYQSDAAEALVWAAAIGDDNARTGAANILIQDWSMADNADCRAAIESLDAPEAVKAGFLKLMRPEQP